MWISTGVDMGLSSPWNITGCPQEKLNNLRVHTDMLVVHEAIHFTTDFITNNDTSLQVIQ